MRSFAEIQLSPPALIRAQHITSGTTEIDMVTGTVTCLKTADMSRCIFSNFRVELDPAAPFSGDFLIKLFLRGAARDPCVNLAADIDYIGEISTFCSLRAMLQLRRNSLLRMIQFAGFPTRTLQPSSSATQICSLSSTATETGLPNGIRPVESRIVFTIPAGVIFRIFMLPSSAT
jgi:hypothetical protein